MPRPLHPSPLAALLLAAACSHGEPFTVHDSGTDRPFDATEPVRLTYNDRDDRAPAWLADGSAIVYASELPQTADHDRCVVVLPPGGGRIQRTICLPGRHAHATRKDVMEAPAVSADGKLAYLFAEEELFQNKRAGSWLMLTDFAAPEAPRRLKQLPYLAPSGRGHSILAYVEWLDADRFVYLGQLIVYEGSSLFTDTTITGQDVMLARLVADSVELEAIPGTDYASSVAADGDGTIYYTLGGDSRVYRRTLSTGATEVAWDFGAGNVVRDVTVRKGVLAAVVGRSVLFRFEPANGMVQRDEGGDLHLVDLATGPIAAFAYDSTLFHRPRLSPDARHVVVEAAPYAPVHDTVEPDFTALNHRHDLWLFAVPASSPSSSPAGSRP